jgi:nucleoside-diphosphate-sugar epimerase
MVFASSQGMNVPLVLNFGPERESLRSVTQVLDTAKKIIPSLSTRIETPLRGLKETQLLSLDSSNAQRVLGWENEIDFEKAVRMSFAELDGRDALQTVQFQIREFLAQSRNRWFA